MKNILTVFLLCFFAFGIKTCGADPRSLQRLDYPIVDAMPIAVESDEDFRLWGGFTEAKIFKEYSDFAKYGFPLDYNEDYFEDYDLLIFSAKTCSSENMQFHRILNDGEKLSPVYIKDKIGDGEPLTDDIIYLPYYAELKKSDNYYLGEVIFNYR